MRYLRYLAILSIFLLPASFSHAQVAVGVGVGVPYGGYAYGPPVCDYGYYDYPPYACAPYGYYGPDWFYGGVFIGAGPWFRGGYRLPRRLSDSAAATDFVAAMPTAVEVLSEAAASSVVPVPE